MEETINPKPPSAPPKFAAAKPASTIEKVFLVFAVVCIFGGAALFIYGNQAVGIGEEGVINKLLGSFGVAIACIGMLISGFYLAKRIVASLSSMNRSERSSTLRAFRKQLGIAVLNVFVYGTLFILVMGGIAALDGAGLGTVLVAFAVWAICIAVFVLYRRHRKKHKTSYNLVEYVGVTIFLFLFALIMLGVFIKSEAPGALQDFTEGPQTADVFLVEAEVSNPAPRYSALVQSTHILTFYTAEGERIVLTVPDRDIAAAKVINDYGNFVHLTYYPNSQVFCAAAPWSEGLQVMGMDQLLKLQEEYDFDL